MSKPFYSLIKKFDYEHKKKVNKLPRNNRGLVFQGLQEMLQTHQGQSTIYLFHFRIYKKVLNYQHTS